MERVWEDLRQCHRLRNEMSHLVASLQSYIMFEVVEAAWTAFMERLKTTQDLDGLIRKASLRFQSLCSTPHSESEVNQRVLILTITVLGCKSSMREDI